MKKYLVHSEQLYGGYKIKLFSDEELAFNYAKEWVNETNGKFPIVVSIFEPNEDGSYDLVDAKEPKE